MGGEGSLCELVRSLVAQRVLVLLLRGAGLGVHVAFDLAHAKPLWSFTSNFQLNSTVHRLPVADDIVRLQFQSLEALAVRVRPHLLRGDVGQRERSHMF